MYNGCVVVFKIKNKEGDSHMNPKPNVLTKVVDLDWTVEATTSSSDPYVPGACSSPPPETNPGGCGGGSYDLPPPHGR